MNIQQPPQKPLLMFPIKLEPRKAELNIIAKTIPGERTFIEKTFIEQVRYPLEMISMWVRDL